MHLVLPVVGVGVLTSTAAIKRTLTSHTQGRVVRILSGVLVLACLEVVIEGPSYGQVGCGSLVRHGGRIVGLDQIRMPVAVVTCRRPCVLAQASVLALGYEISIRIMTVSIEVA